MNWIYLSPHFDDVVFSCGGLIWEQTRAGEAVSIWTICGGEPPEGVLSPYAAALHARWETGAEAVALRRSEDITACALLSATPCYFPIPDCVYRRVALDAGDEKGEVFIFPYDSDAALFGALHPGENALLDRLSMELSEAIPPEAELVSPLALGGHVDHQLTRAAAERLNRSLWYYADYPYAAYTMNLVEALHEQGIGLIRFSISEQGLEAWQRAAACYQSQISTFWQDEEAQSTALREYLNMLGGGALWRRREGDQD